MHLKKSLYHTLKDVSLALDEKRVIIFKTMPDTVSELFSDYKYIVGEYLHFITPMRDMANMFYIFESKFPEGKIDDFIETVGALSRNNFNFNKAAQELFIHKNTLIM
ncbi:helix-turn-helix domain-containing protein [Pseudobutyrivibrio xylanivorans]|uniref:Uncharacterized protein n=1 Tax=Pseudobutyrivibrio xylanivorans TaxID=185007 RepID=A0A5P6VVA6_PSEXY|nr:helix-turn-helix domain-containing protein [Pseudobutyrivibrio xylanivorans]QFJ56362.1 hypothetical protein FXF36_15725 [Pseudobutyrivibrio xylanivorans]